MAQKGISFQEACEWIAEDVFDINIPLASDSEVQMMKLAAKEMVQDLKDDE